ncbi:glycosyltransferase family 4 protein [Patescibacteria group bacterium]|nr:glycosyltransferase family 4 protein [Patescibacteria group bacterium]
MKIAMIGQKGLPGKFGGVETHVAELAPRLARFGHDVVAYARYWYTPKTVRSYFQVRVVRLPSIHTKNLDAITHTFLATVHALFVERPDVYHFHGVGPSLLAFLPRILAPRATVLSTFHSVDRTHAKWSFFARFMLKLGERAAVAFPHQTIAVSQSIASYVKKEYGARATYVPNGITPVRASVNDDLLEQFGLVSFRYIAMVSRLVRHKGQHTLIAAWKYLQKHNASAIKGMKLAIIGDGAFTDTYVRELKELAQGDDSIVFTGNQSGPALQALFMGTRFVVHPSVSEGLPIALLEAMSYGKAVIAADIPENKEVVADHGIIVPKSDEKALAREIADLLKDPMHAASLGHSGRAYVETSFNWDDIAIDVLRCYRGNETIYASDLPALATE